MRGTCIVTGGAGFIGCAISAGLADRFDRVVVVDILHPQIHPVGERPERLSSRVELLVGDVAEIAVWRNLLASTRPDVIVHLAAETGTGQSLTEAGRHSRVNVMGTTAMLDALAEVGHVPEAFLLSSSRAVYGEGPWQPFMGGPPRYPGQRDRERLAKAQWDFEGLIAMPVSAGRAFPNPVSVYGATKLAQENILSAWCAGFGSQMKTLRFQNVYGPGQALSNPYTGIVSLFCRLAREGKSIPLYEDGEMLRDFVLIDDVADAILTSLDADEAAGRVLDVGTGRAITIAEMARVIAAWYGAPEPHVCGKYRYGDVRHAACDPSEAFTVLGWHARHSVEEGVDRLASWIGTQLPAKIMGFS